MIIFSTDSHLIIFSTDSHLIISATQVPSRPSLTNTIQPVNSKGLDKSEITEVSPPPHPPPFAETICFKIMLTKFRDIFYHSCFQNCLIVSQRHRHQVSTEHATSIKICQHSSGVDFENIMCNPLTPRSL